MEMEGGSGGKITIDHYTRFVLPGFDFRGGSPRGTKTERAAPFASQLEAGNVHLIRGAWNADFIDECVLFPLGEYKDQVDAASGAFDVVTPGRGGSPNVYKF
jgi:predicted phage terminase large subunit-like protein